MQCKSCYSNIATRVVPTDKDKRAHDHDHDHYYNNSSTNSTLQQLHLKEEEDRHSPSADSPPKASFLVNMGPLVDATIPKSVARLWAQQRYCRTWEKTSAAAWATATATASSPRSRLRRVVHGACACGATQDRFFLTTTELQHCYCRLCRQLSGAPFMTWLPVWNRDLQWSCSIRTKDDDLQNKKPSVSKPPPLVRTTAHGQRHFCPNCHGALTIVYDDQPDVTWPAAGSLQDADLPSCTEEEECGGMSDLLYRTVHICCRYKQDWHDIPKDNAERLPEAS